MQKKKLEKNKRKENSIKARRKADFDELFTEAFSGSFIVAILCFIPLYYENEYFNMLQAKAHAWEFLVMIYLPVMAAALALGRLIRMQGRETGKLGKRNSKSEDGKQKSSIKCPAPEFLPMILLALSCLLSCLLSKDPHTSFWGTSGWKNGAFMWLTLAAAYILLCRFWEYHHDIWIPGLLVNDFIFSVGILHSASVDVFDLHEGIAKNQFYIYISTIGNLNWFAGYLCLLVPMVMVFYMNAKERFSKGLYLSFLALASINMVLCASDGMILGLGVCAFFAIPYVFAFGQRIRRASEVLTMYGISLLLVGNLPVFAQKAAMIEGISKKLLNPAAAAVILAAGILGIVLAEKIAAINIGCDDKKTAPSKTHTESCETEAAGNQNNSKKEIKESDRVDAGKIQKQRAIRLCPITLLLESSLTLVAFAFLIHSVQNFSDSWGNKRGHIWRLSMEVFRDFSWKEKLFGVGPDMLREYYTELTVNGRPTIVAHSEPLQMLLTIGIIGLVIWCWLWAGQIGKYFKYRLWKKDEICFFLPLAAYLGQSLVNSPQATNLAILMVIMVCLKIFISHAVLKSAGDEK